MNGPPAPPAEPWCPAAADVPPQLDTQTKLPPGLLKGKR
jgi:hypothetical protein